MIPSRKLLAVTLSLLIISISFPALAWQLGMEETTDHPIDNFANGARFEMERIKIHGIENLDSVEKTVKINGKTYRHLNVPPMEE